MVNYTSIPCDAPRPQRYLFRHGNGRGLEKLHVASRDGSVPAMGVGDGERRGSVAFLALQRFGLKSSRDSGRPACQRQADTPALSTQQP